jgi:hypothetical protein
VVRYVCRVWSIPPRTATLLLLGLLGCAAACSSSPSAASGGLTTGTANLNSTFTFVPAVSYASAAASPVDGSHTSVVVTSLRGPDSCTAVQMSTGAGVASVFQLVVTIDSSGASQVVAPGTYTLGHGWQATYRLADATCASADEGAAIKGSLEIDRVDTSIHGIADVTFPTGRAIATFDAPLCASSVVPSGGGACAQVPLCPAGYGTDLDPVSTSMCTDFP